MDHSFLQRVKTLFQTAVPLSNDAVLILFGLTCYLVTCLIARQALTWAWALLPGLFLSLTLEGWEIWDHYGARGLRETGIGGLTTILLRHGKDVLVVNLASVGVFLTAHALDRLAAK